MSDEVNYKGWAVELCSLLDAIEIALGQEDLNRVKILIGGRFRIAKAHGIKIKWTGTQAAGMQ